MKSISSVSLRKDSSSEMQTSFARLGLVRQTWRAMYPLEATASSVVHLFGCQTKGVQTLIW